MGKGGDKTVGGRCRLPPRSIGLLRYILSYALLVLTKGTAAIGVMESKRCTLVFGNVRPRPHLSFSSVAIYRFLQGPSEIL